MPEWQSGRAAGWYGDPYGRYSGRYWDGSAWTEQVRDSGGSSADLPGRRRQRLIVATRTPKGTNFHQQGGPSASVWGALLAGYVLMEIVGIGQLVLAVGAHWRSRTADLTLGCWLSAFPLFLARVPIRFLRHPIGVAVDPQGLTATNFVGPIRRAEAADIVGISVKSGAVGRSVVPQRIPSVELADGTTFRLEGMAARVGSAAEIENQRRMLDEILSTLGVTTPDGPSAA